MPGPHPCVAATRVAPVRRTVMAAVQRSGPGLWSSIACRKRLIDERLSDPLNETDAVVVVGAGFDTRGCRIARHSDMPVYEVDQAVTIERKAAVLQRVFGGTPASVHLVAADLERDDLLAALQSAGYDASRRTFFIVEGVTQYLSPDALRATLAALGTAAPGSRLVFNPMPPRCHAERPNR